jgi:hypothetical protein
LEIHETRVEILDSYNELKLVALIEVVSPSNRAAGPGRVSYKAKQAETFSRDCHLVEIKWRASVPAELTRAYPINCRPFSSSGFQSSKRLPSRA